MLPERVRERRRRKDIETRRDEQPREGPIFGGAGHGESDGWLNAGINLATAQPSVFAANMPCIQVPDLSLAGALWRRRHL